MNLPMQELQKFWNFELINTSGGMLVSVGDVLLVLLFSYLGYLMSRLIGFILGRKLNKTDLSADAVNIIKRISHFAILILVALTILGVLGIPLTAFTFATGAIAIGVGFGAQNIINNFISGWIIIAEHPIRVDDYIEIDGYMGTVVNVGTRSTLIHRTDGVHILVPNSKLLENTVVNWTLLDGLIRTTVRVGVAYGSDPQLVAELIEKAVVAQSVILQQPVPEFIFEDFGDNALIFDAYFWCDVGGEKTLRSVRSDVRFTIAAEFDKAGIVVAFPQRDIHLYTEKPISVRVES